MSSVACYSRYLLYPCPQKHDHLDQQGWSDLKVDDELLDDSFSCDEPVDEDVRGTEVLGSNVLHDERLIFREGEPLLAREMDVTRVYEINAITIQPGADTELMLISWRFILGKENS